MGLVGERLRQVPYRLPELREAVALEHTVVIVEGEKDAEALAAWGIPATCNAGGAGKWSDALSEHFRGADVLIVPDNDNPGKSHARAIADSLSAVAGVVRILELPGLPAKGDFSDWVAAGGTPEEFWRLAETEAEEWNGSRVGDDAKTSTPAAAKPDTKGQALPFTTFEDARNGSASPKSLLKYLLAYNERSGWAGPPGSLKSAILTDLAYAVATDQDWCGKRNKGKCAVIYFALERADLVKRRLRAYADQDGKVDVPIAVVGQSINFMDQKSAGAIIATIDAVEKKFDIKVGFLIIDTLAKAIAASGGDENTAKDQGKFFANLDRVKEQRSVHVAIVCHPP